MSWFDDNGRITNQLRLQREEEGKQKKNEAEQKLNAWNLIYLPALSGIFSDVASIWWGYDWSIENNNFFVSLKCNLYNNDLAAEYYILVVEWDEPSFYVRMSKFSSIYDTFNNSLLWSFKANNPDNVKYQLRYYYEQGKFPQRS